MVTGTGKLHAFIVGLQRGDGIGQDMPRAVLQLFQDVWRRRQLFADLSGQLLHGAGRSFMSKASVVS